MDWIKRNIKFSIIIIGIFILFGNNIYNMFYGINRNRVYHKITSAVTAYSTLEGANATVVYTEQDGEYAYTVTRIADAYFPLLKDDLDYAGTERPCIIVYPDSVSMSYALGIDYENNPPMGVYYAGIINILSPEAWVKDISHAEIKNTFMENGPVIHEMVHYIIDMKLQGNYDVWFTESMALYYEYKYTGISWREDLKGTLDLFYAGDIKGEFNALGEPYAYRYAFEIAERLVSCYGEEILIDLVETKDKAAFIRAAFGENM